MAAKAELKAKLSLDKSAFSRGLKAAYAEAREFGRSVAAFVGGKLIADGLEKLAQEAINTGRAFAEGVKHAYDLGSELQDMSDKTGIAADQIMILQQAAKDNGVEDITGAIGKMQKNLVDAAKKGAGPAAEALDMLGLSADDLINKLPTEQLQAIGDKIMAIRNPALRTAEAIEIFGKQGKELLPLFADSEALGTAAKSIGKQAQILRDSAQYFDKISDRLGRAGLKLQGFFVGVAADILPYMDLITQKFDELDLADMGTKFGEGIKTAMEYLVGAFSDPAAMFSNMIQYLEAGMLGVGNALIAGIKAAISIAPQLFNVLADGFIGLQQIISGSLMKAFAGPIEWLTAAIQHGLQIITSHADDVEDKLTVGGSEKMNSYRTREAFYFQQREKKKKELGMDASTMTGFTKEANEALEEWEKKNKPNNPLYVQSTEEIQKQNGNFAGALGEEQIKDGLERVDKATKEFFDAMAKAIKNFKIEDILGAATKWQQAVKGSTALAKKGKEIIAAMKPEPTAPDVFGGGGWGALSGFTNFGGRGLSSGGLRSGGLSNMPGVAYGQTGLLRHGEIMASLNASVASGASGRDVRRSNRNAYGVVMRGDKARARAYAQEQERKKMTLEGTNERLDTIIEELKPSASPIKPQGGKN